MKFGLAESYSAIVLVSSLSPGCSVHPQKESGPCMAPNDTGIDCRVASNGIQLGTPSISNTSRQSNVDSNDLQFPEGEQGLFHGLVSPIEYMYKHLIAANSGKQFEIESSQDRTGLDIIMDVGFNNSFL